MSFQRPLPFWTLKKERVFPTTNRCIWTWAQAWSQLSMMNNAQCTYNRRLQDNIYIRNIKNIKKSEEDRYSNLSKKSYCLDQL